MKVFIIDGNPQYVRMFIGYGWGIVGKMEEADLVQFTGGEDVEPLLYGEMNDGKSSSNPRRDLYEVGLYLKAKKLNKPCAGICRGGQFLNVVNGGRMIQHVDGHCSNHLMHTKDGKEILATSTHHQMMVPSKQADLVAWGTILGDKDPEVIRYKTDLCFQPHPEFGSKELRDYYFSLVKGLIAGG